MPFPLKAAARALALLAIVLLATIAPASATSSSSYKAQVIDATNSYRVTQGLSPVSNQKCLDRWARSQARWMARNKTLQHRPGRLYKIIKSCKLRGASENIAEGFRTGSSTVVAWSGSPGHAANMSAPQMRLIGVSAVLSKQGVWYVAQVFGTRR